MNIQTDAPDTTIAVPSLLLRDALRAIEDATDQQTSTVKFFGDVMQAGDCQIEREKLYRDRIAEETTFAVRGALNNYAKLTTLRRRLASLIERDEQTQDAAGYEKLRNEYRTLANDAAQLDPETFTDRIKFGIAWRRAGAIEKMKGGVPVGAFSSLLVTREKFLGEMQRELAAIQTQIKGILKRSPDRTKRSAAKTAELDTLQDRASDLADEIVRLNAKPAGITDDQPPAAETSPADHRIARYRANRDLNR